MNILKNEYPRPQFERSAWLNLNGTWQFEIDNSMVGQEKEFYKRNTLSGKINVPFCPESALSGVENKDFMNCIWYKRDFDIPKEHTSKRVILHFGAIDYHAYVYVNEKKVGEHVGGYTPFSFDITDFLKETDNNIVVCAEDDARSGNQPLGKQSDRLKSYGCSYTRTTGIWQTVWLEFVDECYIESVKITTEINLPSVNVEFKMSECFDNVNVTAEAFWDGNSVGKASVDLKSDLSFVNLKLDEKHLWEVGKGNLYDLKLTVKRDGVVCDEVLSYFGLRTVCLDGRAFKINGKTVFGRWVLDQGFYPNGIYTAPSDDDLKNDILNSQKLGFNGARLHEKVFEPRFLYWADKLGYIVWGEFANWGLDITETGQISHFLPEWIEAMKRDINHPSIIGWCPFNETWDYKGRKQSDMIIKMVYEVTKEIDPSRPVIDTSGNFHVETDIFDVHDYEQNPTEFSSHYEKLTDGIAEDTLYLDPLTRDRQKYDGISPVFVSEYGGIQWPGSGSDGWGYGEAPKSEAEFLERYRGLTEALINNPYMLGFCYTQLYDVEQEINGLMTYDRKFKFDPEIIKKINSKKAAIEIKDE